LEEQGFLESIQQVFPSQEQDIRSYSPLSLAFLGDAVYELVVRTVIVRGPNRAAAKLHDMTVRYVNAPAQARMVEIISPLLTQEESDVLRRGKNASPHTIAKSGSRKEYLRATGFEALMGYLYLTGRTERMLELVQAGMQGLDGERS